MWPGLWAEELGQVDDGGGSGPRDEPASILPVQLTMPRQLRLNYKRIGWHFSWNRPQPQIRTEYARRT